MEKGDPAAVLSRQSLGIVRDRSISDAFEERIRVHNYTLHAEGCLLTLGLDADFADIFEVRGVHRAARGERQPTQVTDGLIGFGYTGLDGRYRRTWVRVVAADDTRIVAGPENADGSGHGIVLGIEMHIPPGGERSLDVRVTSEVLDQPLPPRRDKPPSVGAMPAGRPGGRPPCLARDVDHGVQQPRGRRSCLPAGHDRPATAGGLRALAGRAVRGGRHPLVRHPLRTRLHHHGAADAAHPPTRGTRHAAGPGQTSGDRAGRPARRAAGQDPARAADGRARRGGRDPAYPLLRIGRLDAPVADAAG